MTDSLHPSPRYGASNRVAGDQNPGVRTTFSAHLARLDAAQKPGGGVPAYMRWVNRRLARGIAALAATLGFSPNFITAMSATLTATGLMVLMAMPATPLVGVVVAVLLALGFAFDSADGQLARLTGNSSPAGEWLDHVVDGLRTPAVHVCVAGAVLIRSEGFTWVIAVAACFAVLASGQFISQILAEQLMKHRGVAEKEPSGILKSFALLPTDTGVMCWLFLLWGSMPAFVTGYTLLFITNFIHAIISMRRKYAKLSALREG